MFSVSEADRREIIRLCNTIKKRSARLRKNGFFSAEPRQSILAKLALITSAGSFEFAPDGRASMETFAMRAAISSGADIVLLILNEVVGREKKVKNKS